MAQITSITSEALQAQIRRLLPSQVGFGEDLQAVNVITPILDITPAAEGSQLPNDLARAINFTDATAISTSNATNTHVSTPGFYRIIGTASTDPTSGSTGYGWIQITNGLATKVIWGAQSQQGVDTHTMTDFDFIVFLDTGESLQTTANSNGFLKGSVRQVADRYGTTSNPTGFTFE